MPLAPPPRQAAGSRWCARRSRRSHHHQRASSSSILVLLMLLLALLLLPFGSHAAFVVGPCHHRRHGARAQSGRAAGTTAMAASAASPVVSSFDNVQQQAAIRASASHPFGYTAALVVPTGVGAAIGGYAGDAMPVARGLASVVDTLVTHPNVMNGASLYWPQDNILYTEGYALDEFAGGRWGLRPFARGRGGHRVGLVLDRAMEEEMRLRHLQVADGARATLGLTVTDYVVTDEEVGVGLAMSPGGASWGRVRRPDTILRAAKRLVEAGCTAVAVVARFPDDEDPEMLQAYRQGCGVDAVGGAEAIISHLVTAELQVPCAHAPGLPPLDVDPSISPKSCGEEIGYTFLACVLANLHRAPLLVPGRHSPLAQDGRPTLWAEDVSAIVAPASACGGPAVLSLLGGGGQAGQQQRTVLVAVEENTTEMKASPERLFPQQLWEQGRIVRVRSYLEAMGFLAAHKAGLNPGALTPNVASIRRID